MPGNKQKKGKKRVWLWAIVAALVVGVGAAAYYLPSTDFYQGFMRFAPMRPAVQPRDAVREREMVQPSPVDMEKSDMGLIEDKVRQELAPSKVMSVRDFDKIDSSIDALKDDVSEDTFAYQKMDALKGMIDLAEDNPALIDAIRSEMRKVATMSQKELTKDAKVLRVERATPAGQVFNKEKVMSFNIDADIDTDVNKVAVFIDDTTIDAVRDLQVAVNGEIVAGEWVSTNADVYEYQFADSVSFNAEIENQMDVVVAAEGDEAMYDPADFVDSAVLTVENNADDAVMAVFETASF
jgi:hypothetical protein